MKSYRQDLQPFVQGEYVATVADGNSLLAYHYYNCSGHLDAVERALSEHKGAGYPLPSGTQCEVKGGCQDRACDCGGGKIRHIVYVVQ